MGKGTPATVYLDESMRAHTRVLVSAGRRGLDVELAPADLTRLTGGAFAALTTG